MFKIYNMSSNQYPKPRYVDEWTKLQSMQRTERQRKYPVYYGLNHGQRYSGGGLSTMNIFIIILFFIVVFVFGYYVYIWQTQKRDEIKDIHGNIIKKTNE